MGLDRVEPIFECAGAAPTMEISLNQNDCPMEKCDALLYETAPTTAYPASYTVLKADPNDIKSNPEIFENTDFGTCAFTSSLSHFRPLSSNAALLQRPQESIRASLSILLHATRAGVTAPRL